MPRIAAFLVLLLFSVPVVDAQSVRDHTRLEPRGTRVSKSQAEELTLTVTEVAFRPVQTWVRTAGRLEADRKTLSTRVDAVDAAAVRVGQRVRAFPPEARSSMSQAKVTRIVPDARGAVVQVALAGPARDGSTTYVLEIVADRGEFLTVPNEAIIEENEKHIVYVQRSEGQFEPREIHTGIQGELFTQVVDGLKPGEHVVTFGSFFIDSEYKLKGTAQSGSE
jgi:hypothetical protein